MGHTMRAALHIPPFPPFSTTDERDRGAHAPRRTRLPILRAKTARQPQSFWQEDLQPLDFPVSIAGRACGNHVASVKIGGMR